MGLTAHFTNSEFQLKSVAIGTKELTDRHTSEYIATCLIEMCGDWLISEEKVSNVTTDSAPNMIKAFNLAFPGNRHIPCYAHLLNLIVTDSIKDTFGLDDLIKSIKDIVTHFKQSNNAAGRLRKAQITPSEDEYEGETEIQEFSEDEDNEDDPENDLCNKSQQERKKKSYSLIQSCETRFNSDYAMVKRFLDFSMYVSRILYNNPKVQMLRAEELKSVQDAVNVLVPIDAATKDISGEKYVTGSRIIPLTTTLLSNLQKVTPESTIGYDLQNNLLRQLERRFRSPKSHIEKNEKLAIATILDPRFKKIDFSSALNASEAIQKIKLEMEEMDRNDSSKTARHNCTQKTP